MTTNALPSSPALTSPVYNTPSDSFTASERARDLANPNVKKPEPANPHSFSPSSISSSHESTFSGVVVVRGLPVSPNFRLQPLPNIKATSPTQLTPQLNSPSVVPTTGQPTSLQSSSQTVSNPQVVVQVARPVQSQDDQPQVPCYKKKAYIIYALVGGLFVAGIALYFSLAK